MCCLVVGINYLIDWLIGWLVVVIIVLIVEIVLTFIVCFCQIIDQNCRGVSIFFCIFEEILFFE